MELGTSFFKATNVNQTLSSYAVPSSQQFINVSSPSLYRAKLSLPTRKDCCCRAAVTGIISSLIISEKAKRMSSDLSRDLELSSLSAPCPLDGRYWGKVKELAPYMSEYGLIRFRVLVEIKWLLKLSQIPQVIEVPCFSEGAQSFLQNLINEFSLDDALEVKKIEKVTNHDVKAVEYFLKQRCQSHPEIVKVLEFFHFACTSEDINNLAHALMMKEALSKVTLPVMDELIAAICNVATTNSSVPMLSRTHGQITKAGEIGSSTMPHKVNPIDFENSEGNLGVANGDLSHLSTKLPISGWQRDLTDSTVLRNMGVGLGQSLLAYKSALQGIAKLQVNEAALAEDLNNSWEVLAEPIQTVMRRYGVPEPYEKLKELTRGRAVTKESITEFIEKLDIPIDAKTALLNLTPHTNIGVAADLAKNINKAINMVNRK
ncbi:PREDICTED: uncharacterized protein LOC109238973 isoform X1 [Nicotiana attenuata]|uniref:uncharacterized protein LOC109238973 isoform X1 n=1 Tax=Nicotiana attenuata TaxID=49451 RepID=UPI0009052B5F|nr:PREDICTED: uncharacterized protein LOC109238973 isoform X1 [Nicotiana attenuata]